MTHPAPEPTADTYEADRRLLASLPHTKSSYSTGSGSCVAVAFATSQRLVGVQDTKLEDGRRQEEQQVYSAAAWMAFVNHFAR
jgi:hypothetical protein